MSDESTQNTMQSSVPLASTIPAVAGRRGRRPLAAHPPLGLRGLFDLRFLAICIVLVLVEIAIARWLHGGFVRSFVGDVIVVGVVFSLLKTFLKAAPVKVAAGALGFCVVIEALQYVHLVDWLGLKRGTILHIALGATFDWLDLLAYGIGFALLLLAIRWQRRPTQASERP